MERKTDLKRAKEILGVNFIGPEELRAIKDSLGICDPYPSAGIPPIEFSEPVLERAAKESVLIWGVSLASDLEPLTITKLKMIHGVDPARKQPCFYNQDWYDKEPFACRTTLGTKWHLIKKEIDGSTRGVEPAVLTAMTTEDRKLPAALLTAYTFFAYYYHSGGELLWKNDYAWCEDTDSNNDRIYTGRYLDPLGLNKNGFSVHRHLSIKNYYGAAYEYRLPD